MCSLEEFGTALPSALQLLGKHSSKFDWLAAKNDAVVSLKGARRSAKFYGAEFHEVAGAGHNLMMERNYQETASQIDIWLNNSVD